MKQKISLLFLKYLRFFARLQLAKINLINPKLIIVGITGSAGKTSTLLAAEAALKPNFRVKTNYGGNSESGIPLNILGFKNPDFSLFSWLIVALLTPFKLLTNWKIYDVYLVEMGIDSAQSPKNMSYLLSIVKPDIGVFLNVTPVHLENFSSLDQIAEEKAKLINNTQIAIINKSDALVKKYSKNKHTISIKPVKIDIPNFVLPSIYDISLGAALAIANYFKINNSSSINNIKNNFHLPPGRSSVLKGINNSTIIDSSYNSSPLSATEMLNFLASYPSPKITLLGDMRELGAVSKISHQNLYKTALNSADTIISIGPLTSRFFGSKAKKFMYWWQASDYLKNNLPQNATILVKGSQNTIFLEELIKELIPTNKLKHYLSNDLICRQSKYWLKTKDLFKSSNS
ncbi:MAG: Mur ligase family protein [Candidatus Shapirobacteria bacterium]|nr:Mur ligase family protein [Candidatus Shapirobacteria bacterium]